MRKIGQKDVVIGLVVLLILAVSYIIFDTYADYQRQQQFAAYQMGYQQAIVQVMQQLATCQPVPLFAGNQTLSAVAVECLQRSTDVSSTSS